MLRFVTENPIERGGYFVVVTAMPVDLAAAGALVELVVIFPGQWQEMVDNGIFCHLVQQTIAGDAAGKW